MKKLALKVKRGATVALPIRVESDVLVYAPITAIARTAPVSITAPAHSLPDGWRAAVMNAVGLIDLNAESNPPSDDEMHIVTVTDANTVTFNKVNAAGYKRAHVAGTGHLAYYQPLDLSLYSGAIMEVKDAVGGARLALFATPGTLTDPLTDLVDGVLDIDTVNTVLWLKMTDEESEVLDFIKGVFDIKLVKPSGETDFLCTSDSTLDVEFEVTTTE